MILESETRAFLRFELHKTSLLDFWICSVCESYCVFALLRGRRILTALLKLSFKICHSIHAISRIFLGIMTSLVRFDIM